MYYVLSFIPVDLILMYVYTLQEFYNYYNKYILYNITLYNYIYLVKATNKGVWKVIMDSMDSILVQRPLTAQL